jgi:hypothetical protein
MEHKIKIHVIGNSHVNIFRSLNTDTLFGDDTISLFKTHHIGPTIAYNFYEHHYPKILEILERDNLDKQTNYICLIVGEVDCRLHLPKQASIQNKNIYDLTKECVDRFFRCYTDLISKGYKVIVWGGHPSTTSGHSDNPDKPVFGDCITRNKISIYWNNYLKQKSEELNIPFISVMHELILKDGLTNMSYFMDYCHLKSTKIMPLVMDKINNLKLN